MKTTATAPRQARWSTVFLIAALFLPATAVHALPGFNGDFLGQYPQSGPTLTSAANDCTLCHTQVNAGGGSARNPYGQDIEPASNQTIVTRLIAVEPLNSDGDTAGADACDNITEINADTLPGDANSTPANCGAANLPPVADANGPYSGTAGVTVITFDGTGSTDDGTIVSYDWDFGDGTVVLDAGPTPTHTYGTAGTFTVLLTVTDDGTPALTDTATATATIVDALTDPIADPNGPYTGTTGVPLTLDGTGSFDPDGGIIVAYAWDFGDGNTGTGAMPTHTYAAAGTYAVSLTVTDEEGASNAVPATTTATITDAPANEPPTADPNGPYTGTTGQAVSFDGSASADDGTIVSYDWDFGDGTVALDAGPTPTHTYTATGIYTVTLTVTDDGTPALTDTATTTATIADAPACDGITIESALWRTQGNGQLRVEGTGIRNGTFVLSNANDLNQIIDTNNGNNGKFKFNVNGRNLDPVPCRVRVEQLDAGLCGEADVADAPADCAPVTPDQAPVARGDSYATPRGEALTVPATRLSGVLYNDFDVTPTGTLLAVNLDVTGTQGAVSLDPDGSFTYTPPAGAPAGGAAFLDDTFTYQASDGTNLSAVTTVNVRTLPNQTDFKFMMNYELGMHCTGFEFAYCCVLPVYNSIITQIVKPAIDDPATSQCFNAPCAGDEEEVTFLDGFPRLLEGDPNNGGNLDNTPFGRETVVRDPALDGNGDFKKYVVKYWHDAQSRNDGQGKPQVGNPGLDPSLPPYLNSKTLISDVEFNTLLSWNTRADAAARNEDGTFVVGPAECADPLDETTCAALDVVQGNGLYNDTGGVFGSPIDNYQNAVWNHLYIYGDTEGVRLCVDDPDNTHCFTNEDCTGIGPEICGDSTDINKARLGLDVDYPTNFGPGGHPMGPVSGGAFNDNAFMTFSEDTGTVVYTQMKLVENLPVMLTSPRIWEALGLPLTTFEDTLGFFADPGLVDEDSIRPYVQMSAQLHHAVCDTAGNCTAGAAVLDGVGNPVQGFGDAPIDIPNCERCHSAPPTDTAGNLNVNSPNVDPVQNALVTLEVDFWKAYYDLDMTTGDSDWYARLKGAAISILSIHDREHGTQFLGNFPAVSPIQPAGVPFDPVTQLGGLFDPDDGTPDALFPGALANCLENKAPTGPACSTHADCAGIGDEVCDLPQNTRIGHDSVICQKCHADNVIAVVKSTTCGAAGNTCAEGDLIPALTQAIHHNHRSMSEGGDIVFNDVLGRDGGCQGCHPAHRSDGVMDNYPITLDGNNAQANSDNRLAQGGCFVGRDVHSNPMKDVDGAETPSHLNALGDYLLSEVAFDQGEFRGIWCTNCHSQAGQQMWKAENCKDLINNDCESVAENPRAAPTIEALAAALGTTLAQLESWADPKDPGVDPGLPLSGPDARNPLTGGTGDDTHAIWRPDGGLCNYVQQWLNADQSLPPGGIDPEYDGPAALVEVGVVNAGADETTCQTGDALRDPQGNVAVLCADQLAQIPAGFFICGSYDADGDFTAALTAAPGESPFCTTQDCKLAADGTLNPGHVTAQIPFSTDDISTASDGRDHWLSAGEPHCADCHAAPYTEQSGNINPFPPFNYPRRASLMRYSRGHQDVTCQGCHESIHGLYPVTPTIDNTSYAQAAGLNNDGTHGPLKCESCHTHVTAGEPGNPLAGIPTWVQNLTYTDPVNGGPPVNVATSFDAAVSWAHTYTDEADPRADVCQNCHGDLSSLIATNNNEWQIHAMVNRVSRLAMDDAEFNQDAVSGVPDPANPYAGGNTTVCQACHGNEGNPSCGDTEWKQHLTEGRVSESVWEEVSIANNNGSTCGW